MDYIPICCGVPSTIPKEKKWQTEQKALVIIFKLSLDSKISMNTYGFEQDLDNKNKYRRCQDNTKIEILFNEDSFEAQLTLSGKTWIVKANPVLETDCQFTITDTRILDSDKTKAKLTGEASYNACNKFINAVLKSKIHKILGILNSN